MSLQVDRRTAERWMEALHATNLRFLRETADENLVHIDVLFANLTANLLYALRRMELDDDAAADVVYSAAQGMSCGMLTALLLQNPPDHNPKKKAEVN